MPLSVDIMSNVNKFAGLAVEGQMEEVESAVKIEEVVANAMKLIPDRKGKDGSNRQLIGDIVKAVVAAMLPMVQDLSAKMDRDSLSPGKTQAAVQKHDDRLDDIEQYSRRDNVVLRGVPESQGEVTNTLVIDVANSIGVTVTEGDISTSHRMGRPQPNKVRPIVARFVRRDLRTDLLKNKRKLKESSNDTMKNVMLGEHLSPGRAKLLKVLKNDDSIDKVWTIDGTIHCITKSDNKKHTLTKPDDLFKELDWDEEKMRKTGLFVDIVD